MNVLPAVFTGTDSKCAEKRQSSQQCIFTLLGSTGIKAEHKMLVNLTPGLNFINVLRTAFTHVDPKYAKKTVKSAVVLLGPTTVKAAHKMLVNLTPDDVNSITQM